MLSDPFNTILCIFKSCEIPFFFFKFLECTYWVFYEDQEKTPKYLGKLDESNPLIWLENNYCRQRCHCVGGFFFVLPGLANGRWHIK